MRTQKWWFAFGMAMMLALAGMAESGAAASRNDVVKRLGDFQKFFSDFQFAPDSAVPNDLLAECYGVIIMRQYKAGFVLGVKGGDGVILLHDPATGNWTAPAFVVSGEGSFGFQIGGQSIDAIILIMNRDGIEMFLNNRFKIGVDASAAAGPVGRDAAAKVSTGAALLAYSRAKGLYAGMSFEGGALLNYDDFNTAMYGRKITLKEILLDRVVPIPPEAVPLINTLKSYAVITSPQYVAPQPQIVPPPQVPPQPQVIPPPQPQIAPPPLPELAPQTLPAPQPPQPR